jgi:hypothetical protein
LAVWIARPSVAPAEVLVVERGGQLALEVHADRGRIWSPRGALRPGVLNATGDLHGDGYPGYSVRVAALAAAWLRPAPASVEVALAHPDGRVVRTAVAVPDIPVGTPVVDRLSGHWCVTWRALGDRPEIFNVSVLDSGVMGPPVRLGAGTLVGTVSVGETLVLGAIDLDGEELLVSGITFQRFPEIPGDVPIARVTWSATLTRNEWSGVEGRSASAHRISPLGPASRASLAPDLPIPCLETTSDGAVLAWSAGNGLVGLLELDELGPVGDVRFVHGNLGSCVHAANLLGRAERK